MITIPATVKICLRRDRTPPRKIVTMINVPGNVIHPSSAGTGPRCIRIHPLSTGRNHDVRPSPTRSSWCGPAAGSQVEEGGMMGTEQGRRPALDRQDQHPHLVAVCQDPSHGRRHWCRGSPSSLIPWISAVSDPHGEAVPVRPRRPSWPWSPGVYVLASECVDLTSFLFRGKRLRFK